jgi:7-dehydrocholesterol reductase
MKETKNPAFSKPTWGRYNSGKDHITNATVIAIFFLTPLFTIYFHVCCSHFECSLAAPLLQIFQQRITVLDFFKLTPPPNLQAFYILVFWYTFQTLLYLYFPCEQHSGQLTPAGYELKYNVNGLRAWIVSHLLFFVCAYFDVISWTIIYDNLGALLVLSNIWGYILATYCYVKAIYFPTHEHDCKRTGNFLYDYFMGIELNPRIGNFDFKLYFNGRPGIVGWNLINISYIAAQYKIHGEITNGMVLMSFLHLVYILDFFWNEDWYLRTIDIAHDHFGWMLAWGDTTWLPFMYTLQGLYLTVHPYRLSVTQFAIIAFLGLSGYAIFRLVNNQKAAFRKTPPGEKFIIWGKPATYVAASYKTSDGKTHQSNLLTSGFWGWSRHFNYFGDLLISFAYCACCGSEHLLPYFYFIFMTCLLVTRVERDHERLKEKYGSKWDEYCKIVKWKILPYFY